MVASILPGVSALRAAGLTLPSPLEQLRLQAEQCERDSQWEKAAALYEQILGRDRSRPGIKEQYQRCLRRFHQGRRYRDKTFRQRLVSLSLDQAFDLYEEVLLRIQASYVEREKTELNRLFQEGREELYLALGDKIFCQGQPAPFRADAVAIFRDRLRQTEAGPSLRTLRDVRLRLRETVQAAQKELGLNPVAVVLEFACGACNSLDEYSAFLTPGQLGELFAALEGRSVDSQLYRMSSAAGALLEDGVGYLQLAGFQQTTLQEVDDAILRLKTD